MAREYTGAQNIADIRRATVRLEMALMVDRDQPAIDVEKATEALRAMVVNTEVLVDIVARAE
jgi:hypothetical protein